MGAHAAWRALLVTVVALVPVAVHPAGLNLAPDSVAGGVPAGGGDACSAGVILDDGSLETGYGWIPSVVDGRYVQRFEVADFRSRKMEEVCICWTRTQPDDSVSFSVQLYRDVGGRPARFPEAVVEASTDSVPRFPDGAFTTVDVSSVDMRAITNVFYLGVQWDPSFDRFFFVCADHSPDTPVVDAWFIDDRAEEWTSVLESTDPIFDDHRAMLIRARAAEGSYPTVPTIGPIGAVVLLLLIVGAAILALRRRP